MAVPNVRLKHTHPSFFCQARADTLPACVGVCRRLFQTMYFTNHWLSRFLKISSKNYCHQARRQLSTKHRKHECLCSNDEEHVSNGYRRSDICCSSSRDCTNIKIWISKVTNSFFDNEFSTACIFQSPSEISRICASGPWKDYKSSNRVDQVPDKLIGYIWIQQHIHTQHFKSG